MSYSFTPKATLGVQDGTQTTSNLIASGSTNLNTLSVTGKASFTSTTQLPSTSNTISGVEAALNLSGDLHFANATKNALSFRGVGIAPPATTNRSVGTKLVVFPVISPTSVDYAIGIESSNIWFSTATTSTGFKWYGGAILAASLSGAGAMSLTSGLTATTGAFTGAVSGASFAGNLIGGTLSATNGNLSGTLAVVGGVMFSSGLGVSGGTTETYSLASSSKNMYTPAGTVATMSSGYNSVNGATLLNISADNSTNGTSAVFMGAVAGNSNGAANFVIGRRTGVTSWAESLRVDTAGTLLFSTSSLSAPTYTSRSSGTKLVFSPNIGASNVDYAIGMETDNMWFSTTSASTGFKWYAGTSPVLTLTGAGGLTTMGTVSAGTLAVTGDATVSKMLGVYGGTTETYTLGSSSKASTSPAGTVMTLSSEANSVNGSTLVNISSNNSANGYSGVFFGAVAGITNGAGNFVIGRRTGVTSWAESMRIDTAGTMILSTPAVGAPTFTTRSSGTRLVISSWVGPSNVDYAIGCETSDLWFSTPSSSTGFKWYTGITNVMNLSGSGGLSANTGTFTGALSASSFSGNLIGGTVSASTGSFSGDVSALTGTLGSVSVSGNATFGGSLGVTGNVTCSQNVIINGTDESTNYGIGALVLAGGMAVAKRLSVGGLLSTNGGLIVSNGGMNVTGVSSFANTTTFYGIVCQNTLTLSGNAVVAGTISLSSEPTGPTHATTKAYVDSISYLTAGTGLSKSGNTLSINSAQSTITSLGTLTGLTLSGGIVGTSANFSGELTATSLWGNLIGGTVSASTGTFSGITNISNATKLADNTLNSTSGAMTLAGDLHLYHATNPQIAFFPGTQGAPEFTTRSTGTRLIVYPNVTSNSVDYAIGIESGNLWFATAASSTGFKWYGGTTLAAMLSGSGVLVLTSGLSATTGTFSGITNISNTTKLVGNTISSTSGALTLAGDLHLYHATNPQIAFSTGTLAAPTFTSRSAGSRIIVYPVIGAAIVDYAIGIEQNNLWFSTGSTTTGFKWYGGTSVAATLSGGGALSLTSSLSATSGTFSGAVSGTSFSGNLIGGTVSATTGTFSGAVSGTSFSGNLIGGTMSATTGTFSGTTTTAKLVCTTTFEQIIFTNTATFADPSTSSRTAGTRIVVYPKITTGYDYALGIGTSFDMWFSATGGFTWYSTSAKMMQLQNGVFSLLNTTDSSDITNGTFVVKGGAGIAKNLNVGGNISSLGSLTATTGTFSSTVTAPTFATGSGSLYRVVNGLVLAGNTSANYISMRAQKDVSGEFLMTTGYTVFKRTDGINSLYIDNTTGAITVDVSLDISAGATIQGVTPTEFTQLANINSVAISNTQWAYLGALNQNVDTTSSPAFTAVNAGTFTTGSATMASGDGDAGFLFSGGVGTSKYISMKANSTASSSPEFLMTASYTTLRKNDGGSSIYINNATGNVSFDYGVTISENATLNGVTTTELDQIANINNVQIPNAQWANLGNLDQNVSTWSAPLFTNVTIGNGAPTSADHATRKDYVDSLVVTAGSGLTKTGTALSVNAVQPGITSVGTLTSLITAGDIVIVKSAAPTGTTYAQTFLLASSFGLVISGGLTQNVGPCAKIELQANSTLFPIVSIDSPDRVFKHLTNVSCEVAPTDPTHLVTKSYTDAGLATKQAANSFLTTIDQNLAISSSPAFANITSNINVRHGGEVRFLRNDGSNVLGLKITGSGYASVLRIFNGSGDAVGRIDFADNQNVYMSFGLYGTSCHSTFNILNNSATALQVTGSAVVGGTVRTAGLIATGAVTAPNNVPCVYVSWDQANDAGKIEAVNAGVVIKTLRIQPNGAKTVIGGALDVWGTESRFGSQVQSGLFGSTLTVINPIHNGGTSTLAPSVPILTLSRDGISGQTWANTVQFNLSRYALSGSNAKTQLDVLVNDGQGQIPTTSVLSIRGDGTITVPVGVFTVANATDATSATSASLVVTGGGGFGGNIHSKGMASRFGRNVHNLQATAPLEIACDVDYTGNQLGTGLRISNTGSVGSTVTSTTGNSYRCADLRLMSDGGGVFYGALATGIGLTVTDSIYFNESTVLINPKMRIQSTTESTSTSSGALQVIGGVTIGKQLCLGGSINAQNHNTGPGAGYNNIGLIDATISGGGTRVILRIVGANGYDGEVTGGGECVIMISINNTATEPSPTDPNINGFFYNVGEDPCVKDVKFVQGTTRLQYNVYCNFTTYSAHSVHVNGPIGVTFTPELSPTSDPGAYSVTVQIATELYALRSRVTVFDTTDSSSTTSGALQARGGAAIAKNLYVGSNITATGIVTSTNVWSTPVSLATTIQQPGMTITLNTSLSNLRFIRSGRIVTFVGLFVFAISGTATGTMQIGFPTTSLDWSPVNDTVFPCSVRVESGGALPADFRSWDGYVLADATTSQAYIKYGTSSGTSTHSSLSGSAVSLSFNGTYITKA